MPTATPFTHETPSGAILHGYVDLPDDRPGERPAVVICHGFKGFMDWGFFPSLAHLLADRGVVAVRFNVSGSGMRPGEDLVGDPDAFRADTHGREVADFLSILEATGETIAAGRVDRSRIGLLGHSRGGGNAVLVASRSPWQEKLRVLVTWASISTFNRYTPEQKEDWRRDGELPVVNARTGQKLAMGVALLDELEQRGDELDILSGAERVQAPWLIVHGEKDEGVPAEEARRLAERAKGEKELLLIPEGDHTFGAKHPFAGPTPHLIQALNATQRWFLRHL